MKYNTNWLIQSIDTGTDPKYLFFWGHTPKRNDVPDKSCFSQWYPSPFTVDGITYMTAEHWMMAGKALLFNDKEIFDQVIKASSPGLAKELGRQVRGFDPTTWQEKAYALVCEGNRHKFSSSELLKTFLLRTGNSILVEASPSDPVWGIGMAQDNPSATNPQEWKGTNWLGFALMEVRDILL